MKVELRVLGPKPEDKRRIRINHPRCLVGRNYSDLVLTDALCSSQHALFYEVDGELYVRDLRSKNGTWVNGKRVNESVLRKADRITIGRTILVVEAHFPAEKESGSLGSVTARDPNAALLVDRSPLDEGRPARVVRGSERWNR